MACETICGFPGEASDFGVDSCYMKSPKPPEGFCLSSTREQKAFFSSHHSDSWMLLYRQLLARIPHSLVLRTNAPNHRKLTFLASVQRQTLDPEGDRRLRESYHEKMLPMLRVKPAKIVDLGCSTGLSTMALHKVLNMLCCTIALFIVPAPSILQDKEAFACFLASLICSSTRCSEGCLWKTILSKVYANSCLRSIL